MYLTGLIYPVFIPSPRLACPKAFAATRHNVKAWGIAQETGNLKQESPEGA